MVNPLEGFQNNKKKLDDARGKFTLPQTIEVKKLSENSQEVLQRFGLEAPGLLNDYCIALEDALIALVEKQKELKAQLMRLQKGDLNNQQKRRPDDV